MQSRVVSRALAYSLVSRADVNDRGYGALGVK
jgi:hypothetical protein